MTESLQALREILLPFLVELYLFVGLLARFLRPASKGWVRRLVGGLVVGGVVCLAVYVYPAYGDHPLGRMVIYLGLFGAVVVHLKFCLRECWRRVLLCVSLAYAAQNLCYKICLLVWESWFYLQWVSRFGRWGWAISHGMLLLVAMVIYRWLLHPVATQLASQPLDGRMLSISVWVLTATIILCSVEDIAFGQLVQQPLSQPGWQSLLSMRQASNLFAILCCGVVLLLARRTVQQQGLEQQLEGLYRTIQRKAQQPAITPESMEQMQVRMHDLRYQLASMEAQKAAQPLAEMEDALARWDNDMATGNALLDLLLWEKLEYAREHQIQLTCMVDGGALEFLQPDELYRLFGNLLDNALEAVVQLSDSEKQVINLVAKRQGQMVLIQQENYFSGSRQFVEGLPQTTKPDSRYHGFGMRSIQRIAHDYQGQFTAFAQADVFRVQILFPQVPQNTSARQLENTAPVDQPQKVERLQSRK